MYLINSIKNTDGAYSPLQRIYDATTRPGTFIFPDYFVPVFYPPDKRSAGFVTIEDDGTTVTSCVWDEVAYQAWCEANPAPDPLETARAEKEAELSAACNASIVAGMDVTTTKGTEHFSLQETDQINLTTAYNAVMSGATQYPYHADGELCRMFTADEIKTISAASIQHKLYHTTLCNHLLTWARRAETEEELNSITYTADNLPSDLAQNMASVMMAAQNV